MTLLSTVLTVLICSLIFSFVFFLLYRSMLRRELGIKSLLAKLQDEVGQMVTEINRTTERSIVLLEDQMRNAEDILARMTKAVSVLKNEGEKHHSSSKIYTALKYDRPISNITTADINQPIKSRAHNERIASERHAISNTPFSTNPDSNKTNQLSDTDSGKHPDTANLAQSSEPPSLSSLLSSNDRNYDNLPPRQKAVMLYRNGSNLDTIAYQLGMSRGEVELIISLHRRRP